MGSEALNASPFSPHTLRCGRFFKNLEEVSNAYLHTESVDRSIDSQKSMWNAYGFMIVSSRFMVSHCKSDTNLCEAGSF